LQKICIIGSGGAGKTTLSLKLGSILNLPVHHLDRLFWKPGWVESKKSEFEKATRNLVKNENWIIEGNFNSTFHIRFEAADTIIFLDYKRNVCISHALKRYFLYKGKTRPDLAEGCPETLDYQYYKWIWNFPKYYRPGVLKVLDLVKDTRNVIILKDVKETERFLQGLE
jgi:adenylate kinase family enzyme